MSYKAKALRTLQQKSRDMRPPDGKNGILHRDPKNGIAHSIIFCWDEKTGKHKSYIIATTKNKSALHPNLHHKAAAYGSSAKVKSAFSFDTEEDLENILSGKPAPFVVKTVFKKTENLEARYKEEEPTRSCVTEESVRSEAQIAGGFHIAYENRGTDGEKLTKFALLVPKHSGVDLYQYIQANKKRIRTPQFLQIMRACLTTLHKFHEKGYVHVDIKPDNMLYDENTGTVQLIDFGQSYHTENPENFRGGGAPYYRSPELKKYIRDYNRYVNEYNKACKRGAIPSNENSPNFRIDNKTDLYGMGMTIADMYRDVMPSDDDDKISGLINSMLIKDPAKRCTAEQALKELDQIMLEEQQKYHNKFATATEYARGLSVRKEGESPKISPELYLAFETATQNLLNSSPNQPNKKHLEQYINAYQNIDKKLGEFSAIRTVFSAIVLTAFLAALATLTFSVATTGDLSFLLDLFPFDKLAYGALGLTGATTAPIVTSVAVSTYQNNKSSFFYRPNAEARTLGGIVDDAVLASKERPAAVAAAA